MMEKEKGRRKREREKGRRKRGKGEKGETRFCD